MREINEIYNALCCLNVAIRNKKGVKRRIRFIRKLMHKYYSLANFKGKKMKMEGIWFIDDFIALKKILKNKEAIILIKKGIIMVNE